MIIPLGRVIIQIFVDIVIPVKLTKNVALTSISLLGTKLTLQHVLITPIALLSHPKFKYLK
jgi:hypothetical protein